MPLVPQRRTFLLTIGAAQFYILEIKNSHLTSVTDPKTLSCSDAILQNRLLKAVYAVYNLLISMSRKVGVTVKFGSFPYSFNYPIPIPLRPHLIKTICVKCVTVLHLTRDSYLKNSQIDSCHKRVHFFIYLLNKCINLLKLLLTRL